MSPLSDARQTRNEGGRTAGVILAGGRSRRMGGDIKALMPLAGKSLLQHVIDRVAPQVDELYLSVEQPAPGFDRFGLEQVPDPKPGSNGPLGGLLASLERAAADGCDWLLLAPCDAPFLPADLAELLHACAARESADIAVVRHESRLHPTFSLWNRSVINDIERAVLVEEVAGFMQFLETRRYAVLEWNGADNNVFFNINNQAELDEAASVLASS